MALLSRALFIGRMQTAHVVNKYVLCECGKSINTLHLHVRLPAKVGARHAEHLANCFDQGILARSDTRKRHYRISDYMPRRTKDVWVDDPGRAYGALSPDRKRLVYSRGR